MEAILKVTLYIIALVALATGLNVLIGGAGSIPGASTGAEAAVDNELRFFSIFWIAYGGFCLWVARNIAENHHFIPFIALVFLLGGVARLASVLLIGMPGPVLLSAMILEFVLPLGIYIIYQKQKSALLNN